MKKLQIVLAFALVAIVMGNVLFWNITYTSDVQSNYSSGYEQGKTEEQTVAYQEGLTKGNMTGYQTGYDAGYASGQAAGFAKGNQTGYSTGYSVGYQSGSTANSNSGSASDYSTGYQAGYSEGNSSGYTTGYSQGVKDGAGTGYNIRNPTYAEMQAFITSDKTDQNEYVPDSYVCWNFVADFKNNAFQAGYRCGFVYVGLAESAHAIACFNTTNQGLFFVEPQDDLFVSLTIGQPYWNRALYQPTYNDTIITCEIIW